MRTHHQKKTAQKYLLWRVHVGRVFYLTGSVISGLSNHKLVFGVFEHASSLGDKIGVSDEPKLAITVWVFRLGQTNGVCIGSYYYIQFWHVLTLYGDLRPVADTKTLLVCCSIIQYHKKAKRLRLGWVLVACAGLFRFASVAHSIFRITFFFYRHDSPDSSQGIKL